MLLVDAADVDGRGAVAGALLHQGSLAVVGVGYCSTAGGAADELVIAAAAERAGVLVCLPLPLPLSLPFIETVDGSQDQIPFHSLLKLGPFMHFALGKEQRPV